MVSREMLEGITGESGVRVRAGREGRVRRSLRVRLGRRGVGMSERAGGDSRRAGDNQRGWMGKQWTGVKGENLVSGGGGIDRECRRLEQKNGRVLFREAGLGQAGEGWRAGEEPGGRDLEPPFKGHSVCTLSRGVTEHLSAR